MPDAASPSMEPAAEAAIADASANDSHDDENDPDVITDNSEIEDDGGSTTEELDGPDFDLDSDQCEHEIPENYPASIIGRSIYHRYDDGWYLGVVLRQITLSAVKSRNGKFACKFADSINEVDHLLQPEDYGATGHWLLKQK